MCLLYQIVFPSSFYRNYAAKIHYFFQTYKYLVSFLNFYVYMSQSYIDLSDTLGYLNSSFIMPFLITTRHLSSEFSREFKTLLPLNSDFTLTKPPNSLENLGRTSKHSLPFVASDCHFSAFKLLHLCLFNVIILATQRHEVFLNS